MAFLEKILEVKNSTLAGAGKGLFTKEFIARGSRIVEYKGKITTWAAADHDEGNNAYIFYVSPKHVIDAAKYPKALARYANDAKGLVKQKGLNNNAEYQDEKKRVYITATRDIPAGAEILVTYGKDYWDVIRKNIKERMLEKTSGG